MCFCDVRYVPVHVLVCEQRRSSHRDDREVSRWAGPLMWATAVILAAGTPSRPLRSGSRERAIPKCTRSPSGSPIVSSCSPGERHPGVTPLATLTPPLGILRPSSSCACFRVCVAAFVLTCGVNVLVCVVCAFPCMFVPMCVLAFVFLPERVPMLEPLNVLPARVCVCACVGARLRLFVAAFVLTCGV